MLHKRVAEGRLSPMKATTLTQNIERMIASRGMIRMPNGRSMLIAMTPASHPGKYARYATIAPGEIPQDGAIVTEFYTVESHDDDAMSQGNFELPVRSQPASHKIWPIATSAAEVAEWMTENLRWA